MPKAIEIPKTVKVIYTDLDGTMLGARGAFSLDPHGTPTSEPMEALNAALSSGIDIVPVSGRRMPGLASDARLLGLQSSIGEMGAVIAYDSGRTLVKSLGEHPSMDELPVPYMHRVGVIQLLLDEFTLEPHTPWSDNREYTALLRGSADIEKANASLARAGMAWCELHDNGLLHGSYLGLPERAAHVYHVTPRGVSKGSAVALDRSRRTLERDECIAIGDSVADLSMAAHVGVLFVTSDAFDDDPALRDMSSSIDNVVVAARPGNLGWSDIVSSAAQAR
ncbi:MAG: HAD family hydrolase [Actinomycetota bacterium]